MNTTEIKFSCVNDAQTYISENVKSLNPGIIGYWDSINEPVYLKGRLFTKGYFPRWCIRWTSGNGKGLFGNGLACYSGTPLKLENIEHLPICK